MRFARNRNHFAAALFTTMLFAICAIAPGRAYGAPSRYIVTLKPGLADPARVAADLAKQYDGRVLAVWKHALRGFWVEAEPANAVRIAKDKRVAAMEEDGAVHLSGEKGTAALPPNATGEAPWPPLKDETPEVRPLWHLERISHRRRNEEPYYRFGHDGAGARIFVIDSGVWSAHQEFNNGRLQLTDLNVAGKPKFDAPMPDDSILKYVSPEYMDERDQSPSFNPCADDANARTVNAYHGTAAASLAAGRYVGVAQGADLYSVLAIPCKGDTSAALLISGFDRVKRFQEDTGFNKPAVISMSAYRIVQDVRVWNGEEFVTVTGMKCTDRKCVREPELTAFEHAVNSVIDSGIPVVVSANNQDTDACYQMPGRMSRRGGRTYLREGEKVRTRVITVGGIDWRDQRWDFWDEAAGRANHNDGAPNPLFDGGERGSNYGQCVDIWAPGARLVVAMTDASATNVYAARKVRSGTSFAAPMVAGVIARMLAEDAALWAVPRRDIADRVWTRLSANATHLDPDASRLGIASPKDLVYLAGVTFTDHPGDVVEGPAPSLTIGVVKTAGAAYAYRWLTLEGTDAPGSTNKSETYLPTESGTYLVRVTRCAAGQSACSDKSSDAWAESRPVKVTITSAPCVPPVIAEQAPTQYTTTTAATLTAKVRRGDAAIGWELHRIFPTPLKMTEGTIAAKSPDPLPPGAPEPTGDATADVVLNAADPTLEVSTYQFRFCLGVCTPSSCSISSDTVQIRRCQPAPVVNVTPSELTVTSAQDFLQFTAPTATPPVRTQWVYRATESERWKPVRLEDGAWWANFTGTSINPFRRGYYAVITGTACETRISNVAYVPSACRLTVYAKIDSVQFSPGTMPTGTFQAGASVLLTADATSQYPEKPRYRWPDQTAPSTETTRTITVKEGVQHYSVDISDGSGNSDCVTTLTFTIIGTVTCPITLAPKVLDASNKEILFDEDAFQVPPNAMVKLASNARSTASPMRTLTYDWRDESGNRVATTPTYEPPPITTLRSITLTVSDSQCETKYTYILAVKGPSCGAFELRGGYCVIVKDPHIRLAPGRTFPMNPWISDAAGRPVNAAPTEDDPAARQDEATFYKDWYFEWVTSNSSGHIRQRGYGIAYRQQTYVSTGEAATVTVTARRPDGCSATMTYTFEASSLPLCTVNCQFQGCTRHRAVHSDNQPVSVKPFVPGETVTLSVDDATGVTAYEWHRLADGADTIIGDTPTVQVTLTEIAEYWAVLTVNGIEETTSHMLAVPAVESGDVRVTPDIVSTRSGGDFTLTATFSRATLSTRYEWRRASVTGERRLTDPVIGREVSLTIRDLGADSSFWCLVTEVLGDGSELTHSSNFAYVTVECTPFVSGRVNPHPPFLAAGQPSLLGAYVHGKDVTLNWYRLGADGVTKTPIAYGAGAVNVYPTEAVTRYGAVGTDSCGTTGQLDEAVVYVCIPTITRQPEANVVIRGNTTATLTAIAAPAIAGQEVQQTWHYAEDPVDSQPLGSEPSFTTPQIPPGTSRSFKATFKAACSGSVNYTLDSQIAVVEACADPQVVPPTAEMWSTIPGNEVAIGIYASGTDLTYQWYEGNSGDTTRPLQEKTSGNLFVYPQTTTRYWCRVTSRGVCTTDAPSILVRVCATPGVSTHPQSTRIWANSTATLTVAGDATGNTEPITYQWQQGNGGGYADISGATEASFTTPVMTSGTSAVTYRAMVKAGRCSTPSNPATVSVCSYAPVVPARSPESRVVYDGTMTLLLPDLSPIETKSITWYRGARGDRTQPVRSGEGTNLSYTTPGLTADAQYWAELTHLGCKSETETYSVRVCLPEITSSPANRTIAANTTTTLSIAATPIPGQTYRWYSGAVGDVSNPVANGTGPSVNVTPSATTSYWCRATTPCGVTADSAAATVTTCTPATITGGIIATPSGSVPAGTNVTLRVNASGSNKTAQWYRGTAGDTSNPVTNGTAETITVNADITRTYWCRVTTDGICTKDSEAITVAVCSTPTTTQPASQLIWPGESASLSVTASPAGVTVQWYAGLSGDKSNPVSTANPYAASPAATTNYWVNVLNGGCSVASNTATVTVCVLPKQVTASPETQDIYNGDVVTLQLPAMSPAVDKSVTWYRGQMGDKSSPVYAGTNAKLITAVTQTTQYWAEFTHNGCVSRTTTYTVRVCKPKITAHPQGTMVNSGQTHTMSVGTSGENLTYQWYRGASGDVSSPQPGQVAASFTTPPMQIDTAYWCRVGGCGVTADSAAALVSVCVAPTINSITKDPYWTINAPGRLTVDASGPNLTYQWYRGQGGDTSNAISGETNATYNFTLTKSEYYWVRVTSSCANGVQHSVNSAAVLYSVAPKITQQPQSTVNVPNGGRGELSVVADGNYLSYQWYEGSGTTANPVGENKPTFVTPPISTAKTYWVRVTSGGVGYADSGGSTMKLCSGPAISNFTSQPIGDGDDYTFIVTVTTAWKSVVKYHWYSGEVGVTGNSVDRGETGAQGYFNNIRPLPSTFWVRVWKSDGTCYSDTWGITVP